MVASRNWQLESLYRSNAEVPARVAAPLHLLEYTSDLPAGRAAAGSAEGFLTAAVDGPSCRGEQIRGAGELEPAEGAYAAAGAGAACRRAQPVAREALSTERLAERCGYVRDKPSGCTELRASTPVRSGSRGPTRWLRSRARPASLPPGSPRPDGRVCSVRRVHAQARPRRPASDHPRRQRRPAGDGRARAVGDEGLAALARDSTSATTSA